MLPIHRGTIVVRLLAIGIVLASLTDVSTRGASTKSTASAVLQRSGHSLDLVCLLADTVDGPPPRREAKLAAACPGAPPRSRARVVPIGDDRRRALVLRAGESTRASIAPGEASQLRFSVGVRGKGDTLAVQLSLGDERERSTWERTVRADESWVTGEIPVPAASGSTLQLTVTSEPLRARDRDARLVVAAPRLVTPTDPAAGGAPYIVLYLIDTLRADHTPMYGYGRDTMPRLAALARDAVVFENAYSTAARTRPATASALTGLYPSRHHARLGYGIDDSVETLAETLRQAGWSTSAYVTNGNIFAPGFSFEQGFDRFQTVRGARQNNYAYSGEINEVLLPAVRAGADEPFFLYVHTIDPHSPYDPPEGFAGKYRDPGYAGTITPKTTRARFLRTSVQSEADVSFVRDLYDEDILYQDAMFGELLDTLEKSDILDRTLILVVSDHGDEFNEHGGWEHGNRLFQEQIRIPFVVRVPGEDSVRGRREPTPISLVDLVPTVLGLYGLTAPERVQGRDLSAALSAKTGWVAMDPLYAEEATDIPGGDLRTLIDRRWKLIRRANSPEDDAETSYQLFDIESDPTEQNDLSTTERQRFEQMRAALRERSRAASTPTRPATAPVTLDERTRRQLRALGYVDGD